jgi:hypothetical protein
MIKVPAGGAGGGVTSYAVQPATEEQHVGYLKTLADQKQAEHENLQQKHEEADQKLQERQAEAEEGEKLEADVNNPITAETYGRPPQHVPATNQKGPENPADQRDYVDNQPVSEKPAQGDPNQPKESAQQPNPNEPGQSDPTSPSTSPSRSPRPDCAVRNAT